MSDLIRRQDAIEAMGEEPEIWNDTEEEWAYHNAWVEHISAIKALPSAMREPTKEERESVAEYVGKASTPTSENFYDLISRSDIQYHKQLEPIGNGQYSDVEVAYKDDIDALPSADVVSREDYEKIKNMVSTQFQTVLEDYLELEKRYVALLGKQSQKLSAEAVPHGRLIDADALYKKATDLWDKSDSEDFEKGIFKLILNAVSAQTVQCGKENEFIQILKSWETNKVDAISKRFISDAILQKISELNAQGEKAIPIAREFIRFKRFVDGLTPIRTEAVQWWIPCEERLPDEDDEVLATIRYLDEAEDDQTDPYYTIEVIFLHDGKWMGNGSWVESFGYTKVTAWMPLPKPYREESEVEE